jgi:hypothetical protein
MQFHADSPLVFRCEPYAIYWGIQGWSAYNMKQRKALLAMARITGYFRRKGMNSHFWWSVANDLVLFYAGMFYGRWYFSRTSAGESNG